MVDLPTAPKRPAEEPPEQIGRYRITKVLGRGGMGVVYRAHDPEAERDVAIKLILARKGAEVELRKRFEREARALAKLRHKNIMPIHDLGEHDGAPYASLTELLEDLDRYLDGDRPLATRRKIRRRTQADPATQSDEGAAANRRGALNKALVVLVAVQLLALVGVVAWIVSRPEPEPAAATNDGPTKRARATAVLAELDGLHDLEGRLAVCDRALELDPEFGNAYVERARAKYALAQRSATPQTVNPERLVRPALDDLKTALAHDPDSAWAHYVRAEIALEHQHDSSLRVVGVRNLLRVRELDPKGPVGLLARGRLEALKRNFVKAIRLYGQAIERDVKLRAAYVARADAFLAIRNFKGALADAHQAVQLEPSQSLALTIQAAGRFHLRNDRRGALQDLDAALKLHPTFARAIALRSYVRLERLPNGVLKNETTSERDAVKASERDALQALRLDPRTALAHLVLAELYRPNRNLAKALHHANKAVELSFRFEAAHLTRGRLRSLDGDDDLALVDYEEVLDINPNNARALSNKAGILVVRNDHEQARHLIDQALEIDHKLPFAHFLRGYINMRARPRNFRKAIDELSTSIGLDPEYADAYYQRALCLHDIQRFGDCLRDLAKAEALSKKSPSRVAFADFEVALFRGHCHYRRQERERALRSYQAYVRSAPVGHRVLKKIKQRIKEILSKPR